jgi:hypothetical protein
MAAKGKILATGTRVAIGIVGVAASVVVLGGALVVPLPSITATPASVTVDPAPAEQVRACTGPLVRLADDSGQGATTISHVGAAAVVSGTSTSGATLDQSALASPDDTTVTPATSPVRVALPADRPAGTLFAAAQSQSVSSGDLVGLAATACGEATTDSWLSAGATTTGRTSFVILSNPGDVPATVDLSIFGSKGAITAPGAQNLSVAARSVHIVSLAGLAPDEVSPVIHVVSTVGAVYAAVQQSVVRGLTPGGVEVAGPTTAPATTQTIAGVDVSGTTAIAGLLTDPAQADLQSILRLYVPGTTPASVKIHVSEEKTGGVQTDYQVGLSPGVVTEFPLQDIPDGTYMVQVTSDQPLVASARTSTVSGAGTDFAWYPATAALDQPFVAAVAPGPTPELHLINTSGADVTVTVTTPSGQQLPGQVPAGSARNYTFTDPGSYQVQASAPVAATVTYSGNGQISSYGIVRPSPAASPLVVYP